MTATQAPPTYSSARIMDVDLWYPGEPDPIGMPKGNPDTIRHADRGIYIVWVESDSHRGGQQPRLALHVTARP